MTGADIPPAFAADVAGRTVSGPVGATAPGSVSGSVVVPALAPNTYSLFLRVLSNCHVEGENPRLVRVTAAETTVVAFAVTCVVATATLRATTTTTGVDLDRDGYTLRVDGYSVNGAFMRKNWHIDANGTETISQAPTGAARLSLHDMAINCDPTDVTERSASLGAGDTVAIAFSVACMPATDSVAYVSAASGVPHIVIANANGSGGRRLTSSSGSDEDPAWSPDGKKIAFTTDRDGNREIYVVDADGSNLVRLTSELAADYAPAWSPDGSRIAFVSERDYNPEIYVMNADGTSPARLTTNSARDVDPGWSPDGRIAFASDRDARLPAYTDIFVMNADGSNPTRLTTSGAAHPAWSRDGRLAFASPDCTYFSCQPSIVVRSTNGVAQRVGSELELGPGDRPSWSPDGRKLAYESFDCDFYYYTCQPGGVSFARLNAADVISLGTGAHPAWRP
jgi:Tol biopolymer transport system component